MDTEDLMKTAEKNESLEKLNGLGIPYNYLYDSTEDSISGMKTCEKLSRVADEVYKSVLYITNRGHRLIIAVLPCNCRPDTDKLAAAVGIGCHKAGKDECEWFFGEKNGLFCPFGNCREKYEVFLDESAAERRTMVVNAGGAGNYVELAVKDFIAVTRCTTVDLHTGYTEEISGRNYALPIGSVVWNYRIASVRSKGPMEIIYEAEDIETSLRVDICELFPQYRGYKAVRRADGEEVNWFTYDNDNSTRLNSYYGDYPQHQYKSHIDRIVNSGLDFPGSPKILRIGEYNNTIYVVFEHKNSKNIFDYIAGYGKMKPGNAEKTLYALEEKLHTLLKTNSFTLGNIRPDTVFIDEDEQTAYILPFCAPTKMLGNAGMRFSYYGSYDFFAPRQAEIQPENDICSLWRVICCALIGNKWEWTHMPYDFLIQKLMESLSAEKVRDIIAGCDF